MKERTHQQNTTHLNDKVQPYYLPTQQIQWKFTQPNSPTAQFEPDAKFTPTIQIPCSYGSGYNFYFRVRLDREESQRKTEVRRKPKLKKARDIETLSPFALEDTTHQQPEHFDILKWLFNLNNFNTSLQN